MVCRFLFCYIFFFCFSYDWDYGFLLGKVFGKFSLGVINYGTIVLLVGIFVLGIGVGIGFSFIVSFSLENVVFREVIDCSVFNVEVCV